MPSLFAWYTGNFPSIRQVTHDYRALLANPEFEAVYVAVPHHLHARSTARPIAAGKHLMGEKPFGIDLAANDAILDCLAEHPMFLCAARRSFLSSRRCSASAG